MGWIGTFRSIQAAQRQSERDALRRQRELEKQQKQFEKMEELERAAYEVQAYENYLDVLLSIHKECGVSWDWESIHAFEPPAKPSKPNASEIVAQAQLDKYKPSAIDKLLKRAASKKEQLGKIIGEAKQADEEKYQTSINDYEQEFIEWEEMTELANRILADASEAHLDVITRVAPFGEINQLGASIEFEFRGNLIEATLHVSSEEAIPSESRTLLKSGKVSVKKMTKSKFYELYQDYVCAAVLRVARELFALLPIEMVLVTAIGSILNTQTGHMEDHPILSVAIPRKTIENLNIAMLDPSDSMVNFVHRMNFRKTKGFTKVERITPEEL